MKLMPELKLTLSTKYSTVKCKQILEEQIEIFKGVRYKYNAEIHKPYQGEIIGDKFKLLRNITGRNSFQARVDGEFIESGDGTKIKLEMKPHSFTKAFMIFWLLGVGGFCILVLVLGITQGNVSFGSAIPFFMLIFGFLLPRIGFIPDALSVKNDLKEIFKATEIIEY